MGPVTGSPTGNNFVRILGHTGNVFAETSNFTLVGRLFQGAIGSEVTVERANYARSAAGQKVDVFATGFPATQARTPGQPAPAVEIPQLRFYDAPCGVDTAGNPTAPPAGTTVHTMASPGLMSPPQAAPPQIYCGQSTLTIPVSVCVEHSNARNIAGSLAPAFFQANVTDQIFIAAADYDPAGAGTLSVLATSSDAVTPPTLSVLGFGPFVNGAFVRTPLAAPPAKVIVQSTAGGSNEFQVTTGTGATGGGNTPVAANDAVTVAEDSGATAIAVLTNDTVSGGSIPAGATITIVTAPQRGTAVVDGANVNYTPNANANGTDGFNYTVTVGTATSNIAGVTVTVTLVNDHPVAAADSMTAILNVATALDVLANDTDADGVTDLAAPVNVSAVSGPAAATAVVSGRVVTFTASATGTYTFTYQAQDAAGAISPNAAQVTVTVAGAETITIQLAEYRLPPTSRLRVSGVIAPTTTGTVTIRTFNAATPNVFTFTGTAPIVAGAWAFDQRPVAIGNANRVIVTGQGGGSATATLNLRR